MGNIIRREKEEREICCDKYQGSPRYMIDCAFKMDAERRNIVCCGYARKMEEGNDIKIHSVLVDCISEYYGIIEYVHRYDIGPNEFDRLRYECRVKVLFDETTHQSIVSTASIYSGTDNILLYLASADTFIIILSILLWNRSSRMDPIR